MSARTEIENALYRWAWAYDECDLEAFVDTVTEDATVKIEVVTGTVIEQLQGREAVRAFFGGRLGVRTEGRRHVTTNVIIDEESADEARTRSYLTMIQVSDGKPHVIGSGWYRDRLVNDNGTWRIKERHVFLDTFENPPP